MASTLVKNDIHLIFHVKSTSQRMAEVHLDRIFAYIGGIIRGLDSIPMAVGGRPDHIHILCSLPKNMALSDFVRTIKSESSRWIKTLSDGYYRQFGWQAGYGAFSVSHTLIEKTVQYINNQAEHHRQRTFMEEYKLFLKEIGLAYDERYLITD